MNFGIIGYQHFHIDIFIGQMINEGHKFIGVVDADKEAAERCAAQYKVPVYETCEELLNQDIQIVGTSAIPDQRIRIIEWCEKNNLHVVTDKPVVINQEGLEKLQKIIRRNKIQIGVILDFRYHGLVRTLKDEIDKGTLGDLVNIIFIMPHKLRPETRPAWHFSKRQNGGVIIDLMIHSLDLLRWFTCSEITAYKAFKGKRNVHLPNGFFDHAEALLTVENGTKAYIYVDWHVPDNYFTWGDCRIFCYGTKGFAELRLTGDSSHKEPALSINSVKVETLKKQLNTGLRVNLVQDFLNRIGGKKEVVVKPIDILACSQLSIALDENSEK